MVWKNYRSRTFDSSSSEPFKVSRSKIDLFMECNRCFYLDAKLGVKRPSMPAFTLNTAVDHLLKKEFDLYREKKDAHPLMKEYKISAVPFSHKDLEKWRHNFTGIQYIHEPTNLLVFGAVDDIWLNKDGDLHVVDYKATSKEGEVAELNDTRWHNQYRRQMEVYQWLLRRNDFKVSNIGYFVYVNGQKDRESFGGRLEFDVRVISYEGNDSWIEKVLVDIKNCLVGVKIPPSGELCEYCPYRESAGNAFKKIFLAGEKKEEKSEKKISLDKNEVEKKQSGSTLF